MVLRVTDPPAAIKAPVDERVYSAEEWLKLPTRRPYVELIEGHLKKMPNATINHDLIIFNIRMALSIYVLAHKLGQVFGEVNVLIDGLTGKNGWIPDGMFLAKDSLALVGENIEGRPDWVLEVWAGKEKREGRIKEKRERWQRAGVPELWEIIWRKNRQVVNVYRLSSRGIYRRISTEGDQICSQVIAGFCIKRSSIFANLVTEE